jgi:hypothetical protein
MKLNIRYCYLLLSIVLLSACKNEVTPDQKELEAKTATYDALIVEAMAVHDEVMPKMGVLMEYRGRMQEQIKDSRMNNEFAIAKSKLNEAHDGMMEWMRDYSEKFPYGDPAPATLEDIQQKIPVLEQEVEEIKDLKLRTDKIISYAKELLDETEKRSAL